MKATDFLAELGAAGVTLRREGDNLRYRTRPGLGIAPYRERIAAAKPTLLAALDWYAEATAEEGFDRARCAALYQRLLELESES